MFSVWRSRNIWNRRIVQVQDRTDSLSPYQGAHSITVGISSTLHSFESACHTRMPHTFVVHYFLEYLHGKTRQQLRILTTENETIFLNVCKKK